MAFVPCLTAIVSRPGPPPFAGRDAGHTVVWLWGEHDIATVDQLAAVLSQAIALDEADLVLDLSGVTFMGAATLGVILRARVLLRLRSRTLALRSPSGSARRLLNASRRDLSLEGMWETRGPAVGEALSTWVAVPVTAADSITSGCAPSAARHLHVVGAQAPLTDRAVL